MSIFWRKIEKSLDGCPIRNAENRQIEQFREKKRTAPPGKVELLQSGDFYGILIGRKGAVLQVQRSCFPPRCHCSCHRQEEVQFFVILLTVRLFLHEILEGGFHHGNFKYCFFRTEPFGYSRHRRHQCDVDDLKGCLSGQTSGKTLFEKIKWQEKWPPQSYQLTAVMFSNVTLKEGSWPLCGQRLSLSLL